MKIFTLEGIFLLGTLHQSCVKYPSIIFNLFWWHYSRKFWFGTFDRGATRWVKFKNFTLEGIFPLGTLHQWRKSIPSWFLTHFGRTTAENSDSVLSTVVWPVGTFDCGATKSYVWYFRLWCDYFPISELSTSAATNGGWKNIDAVIK